LLYGQNKKIIEILREGIKKVRRREGEKLIKKEGKRERGKGRKKRRKRKCYARHCHLSHQQSNYYK
tara:strand:- start:6 stop:203 length:198 start_codon:yes stop_codon:yes gene_type:complete